MALPEEARAAVSRLPLANARVLLERAQRHQGDNADVTEALQARITELEAPDRTQELATALVDRADELLGDAPTGKVYLAYEWTEEREGKNHIAVCSTLAKAQQACQRSWDDDQGGPTPLQWSQRDTTWAGEKPGAQSYDLPFEVQGFDLDTMQVRVRDPQSRRFQFEEIQL